LILASVAASGPDAFAPSQDLAAQLTSLTGLTVTAREFATYTDVVSNLANGDIHIAWMPPLTYLLTSRRGIVEVALLTNHFGVYFYGSQLMANIGSGLTAFYDPISGQNTADSITALSQLAGKRPCYVDPGSAAGYVVPAGLLELAGVQVLDPAFVQGHPAVVRALYIQGVCDFGATFSISGDPRTSASVLTDLLDARERIVILYQSEAVVPNVNISYLAGLPEEMRLSLNTAFLDLANTSDGRVLLSAAAGNYQIEALKVVDDASYDPLRELSTAIELNLSQLVGK
jgi:phosphonate transport system substrate-binding protein